MPLNQIQLIVHHVVPQSLGQLLMSLYGKVEAVVSEESHIDLPVLLRETQNTLRYSFSDGQHCWWNMTREFLSQNATAVTLGITDESVIAAWCFAPIGLKADTYVTLIGVRWITGRRGGSAFFKKGWRTTAKSSLKKRSLYSSFSSLFCRWKQRENQFVSHSPRLCCYNNSKHTNYSESCEHEISI